MRTGKAAVLLAAALGGAACSARRPAQTALSCRERLEATGMIVVELPKSYPQYVASLARQGATVAVEDRRSRPWRCRYFRGAVEAPLGLAGAAPMGARAWAAFRAENAVDGLGADAYRDAALQAERLGFPASALEHVERALMLSPADPQLWRSAARLRRGLGLEAGARTADARAAALASTGEPR